MSTPVSASSARNEVRGVVPKLVELSEKVLYADVWERSGPSKRDRSLITVAALTALYRSDQLKGHLERGEGGDGDETAIALGQSGALPDVGIEHLLAQLDELGNNAPHFVSGTGR